MSVPFRLRVESGPNAGQSFAVAGSGTTIGRQDGNTIVLDDGRLSRQHARLDLAPGGLTITDLGSANGTRLNGQRISGTQPLHPGDRVQLGETTIIIEGGSPEGGTGGAFIPAFPVAQAMSDGPAGGNTPRLVVHGTGRVFPLDRPSLVIGRQPGNDITLEDTQASRQHARFDVYGDQVTVTDLGSANGTHVNGAPISVPTVLREGDLLQIGTSQLRMEGPGGPAILAPAFGTSPLAPPGPSPLAPASDATLLGGPPGFGPSPGMTSPPAAFAPTGTLPPMGPFQPIGQPPAAGPPPPPGQSWNSPPQPQFGGPPPPVGGVPMPPPSQPRQANRLPVILAAVVGVVLLLCVGGGVVGALILRGGGEDPTATTSAGGPARGTPVAVGSGSPSPAGSPAAIAGSGGGNPAPPPPGATPQPSAAALLPSAAPTLPSSAPRSSAAPVLPSTPPRPSSTPRPSVAPSTGPRPSTPPTTGGAQNITVPSVGLKFTLPAGWTKSEEEATSVTFLSPDRQAIIVVRWNTQVPAGLTAQQLIANELDATARTDPDFDPTTVLTDNVVFGGQPGHGSDVYTYALPSGQRLSEADRAVVLAGRAQYFFGFIAVEDDFARYAKIFDTIIETIVITGP